MTASRSALSPTPSMSAAKPMTIGKKKSATHGIERLGHDWVDVTGGVGGGEADRRVDADSRGRDDPAGHGHDRQHAGPVLVAPQHPAKAGREEQQRDRGETCDHRADHVRSVVVDPVLEDLANPIVGIGGSPPMMNDTNVRHDEDDAGQRSECGGPVLRFVHRETPGPIGNRGVTVAPRRRRVKHPDCGRAWTSNACVIAVSRGPEGGRIGGDLVAAW